MFVIKTGAESIANSLGFLSGYKNILFCDNQQDIHEIDKFNSDASFSFKVLNNIHLIYL